MVLSSQHKKGANTSRSYPVLVATSWPERLST